MRCCAVSSVASSGAARSGRWRSSSAPQAPTCSGASPTRSPKAAGSHRCEPVGKAAFPVLGPSARPTVLAQTTLAAIQGGYLLSTARHDIRPMRTALAAAYAQLRAARLAE